MPYGYAGKMLFVDLSKHSIQTTDVPEEMCREFIGGYGFGIRVLYEQMRPRVDPLGKDNMLGFVVGALTGTSVPGSGRYGVVAKSPLTGAWAESNAGGTLGPEIKTAGFDAVFFKGISRSPVYLLIKDGQAELRDASAIWGKQTYETEDRIHRETADDKLKIASIGPAGEAKSLLAGIVNEKGRVAARSGVGAVMGSKLLKAIAVRGGTTKIAVADRAKLKEAQARFLSIINASDFAKGLTASGTGGALSFLVSIGDSPVKNWRLTGTESMPTANRLDSGNMDKYKKSSYGCHACPIRCGAIIEQKDGPFAVPGEMHRPEYETLAALGNLLANDNQEAVIKANDICNRYGIDTMSTGSAIALAMECYENGLITERDTEGLELTWGSAEAIVALTEKIARREGFGALLADGPVKAAEQIGRGAEKYAIAIRGKGMPFHDPRMSPGGGTAFIADANPGHHMNSQIVGLLENGAPVGNDPVLQMPKTDLFSDFAGRGPMYAVGNSFQQLLDDSGMCALYYTHTQPPDITELLSAVTGWDLGWKEALLAGRRVLTLRQAFTAREGITPDKIDLPERIKKESLPLKTGAPPRIDFQALKAGYFKAMGWDIKTGMPFRKTLEELKLTELVKDI